ncbi:trypsin-like serine protease [Hyalangium minutum]|uniref:trypsin-like serine protease n=1 Tax=Hyalangium minutum TaxID=394096 RepID=UPI00094A9BAC
MPHRESRGMRLWALLGVLGVGLGCAAQASGEFPADDEQASRTRSGTWPRDTQFFMLNAQEDTENRYLSTLIVESEGSPYAFCSGVLLEPNLVLTAGHCVCVTGKSPDSVDTSTCAKRAKVTGYVCIRPADDVLRDLVELSEVGHPWTHDQASRQAAVGPHRRAV